MNDNNVIKTIDKIINLVIVGIIIQFSFLIMQNYTKDNVKLFSSSFKADSISMFKSEINHEKIDKDDIDIVKKKINVYSSKALKKENAEDVIVIKVKTEVKNIVEKAQKQLSESKENIVTSSEKIQKEKNSKNNIPSIWHRVKRGENLSVIAKLYSISITDLKSINKLNSDIILEGQKLKISKTEGIDYKVNKGDSLWVIARKFGTSVKNIMEVNNIQDYEIRAGENLKVYPGEKWFLARKRENSKMFIWPLDNKITSPYGYRVHPIYGKKLFHSGVDIRGGVGEPIKSAGEGKVIYSGNKGGYGKVVIISHSKGFETRYAHCSKLLVKVGDKVKKGDLIANVGSTGTSTGAHLHFEVRKFGKTVNPLNYK